MGGAPLRDCQDPFDPFEHEGARETNHACPPHSARLLSSQPVVCTGATRVGHVCTGATRVGSTFCPPWLSGSPPPNERVNALSTAGDCRAPPGQRLNQTCQPRVGSHPPGFHLLAARAGASTGRPVVACEHSRATHGSREVRGRSVCVGFSLFVEMDCSSERTERRRWMTCSLSDCC